MGSGGDQGCRFVQRRDVRDRAQAGIAAPRQKLRDRAAVGAARVRVADVGGKEFEEAHARPVPANRNLQYTREQAFEGLRPLAVSEWRK
jgi:hypothetical protein